MDEVDKTIDKVKRTRNYKRDDENREYVAEIEKELEQLKSQKGFLKLDYIISIRNKLKSVIVSARLKLVDEDDQELRRKIKADIDSYSWLVKFFSRNVEKEFAEIEQKLEGMLDT